MCKFSLNKLNHTFRPTPPFQLTFVTPVRLFSSTQSYSATWIGPCCMTDYYILSTNQYSLYVWKEITAKQSIGSLVIAFWISQAYRFIHS